MGTPPDSGRELADIAEQLEHLRRQHDLDRRALEALHRISLACRGLASERAIFDVLCRELRAVFALDSCFIAVCDPQNPDVFRIAMLYDEGLVEYEEHVPYGPITGRMIRERIPILVPDLAELRDMLSRHQTTFGNVQKLSRAWMGVPLQLGQDAVGAIALQSYTPNAFSAADHDLLQRIGPVVAVALENVALIRHQRELSDQLTARVAARTEELAALSAIAVEMVLQQPLPELLDRALARILPLLDVKAGNVRLYDRDRGTLVLLAQRGLPPDDPRAIPEIPVEGSHFGTIVRENRPLVIERDLRRHALRQTPSPFESLLGIPLKIGDQMIGSMALLDVRPRAFDPQEIDLAQLIGNQIAIAIANARLLEQRERQIRELTALGAISHAANTSLNLRMLLRQVYAALRDVMPLDVFVMSIYDPRRGVIIEGIGIDEGETYDYFDRNTPPEPGTFTAWILHNRRMLHLRDVAADMAQYPELVNIVGGSGRPAASWLGVPLFDRDERPIGTIVVQSYTSGAFDERDERFLQNVAQQAALHVQNAQLQAQRERQIRELDAIGRIGQLVSATFDLEEILQVVYETLHEVTGAPIFYLLICEPQTHVVTNAVFIEDGRRNDFGWVGVPPQPQSMTAWILQHREPLLYDDLLGYLERTAAPEIRPKRFGGQRHARSWAGVPVLAQNGEPIGVPSVQDYEPGLYDAQTIDLLSQVASHVSLGVQKIRLLRERERRIRELDAIGRIGRLVSASFDLENMLQIVYEILQQVTGAAAFYLVVCEPISQVVSQAYYIERGRRFEDDWVGAPPPPDSLIGWILRERRALLFGDLPGERERLAELGIAPVFMDNTVHPRSWVGVPLLAEDSEPIGAISVQDDEPNRYDEQTVELLHQVASHLSLGVQKIRLFQEREQQIRENARLFDAEHAARRTADTLREVARVLSSTFDASEVLDLILDQLRTVIDYDSASIMLLDGEYLRVAAQRGLESEEALRRQLLSVRGKSGAALAVARRQPVVIDDTLTSPDWHTNSVGTNIRSWLGVPLLSKGRVLGTLNIDSHQPQRFTARDVEVALAFGNQASVALENAQLYEDSVTRVEQELEIAHRIQSNLFPRELPRIPGLSLAARALPARETGGDFYDIIPLGEERFGLLVGDASGKSIPGAMLMAIAHSIARSEARDHELPETAMRETNRWITHDVPPRSFVALSYASLDAGRRRMALANAGQLSPLRRRADGTIEYLDVPGPTLPLGIGPETAYEALEVALEPGDTILFVTDGIVEAHSPSREMFGFERLEALLREKGSLPPAELIEAAIAEVDAFRQGAAQHDDMTLLVLRVE
ncbi:MAG: GAF domain-containing protein [Chloroflexota bacterium]